MKFIKHGLISLAFGTGLLVTSCANEAPWGGSGEADGKIHLNLLTDSSVSMGTRAEEDNYAMSPEIESFSIALNSIDGSYNRTWESVEAFKKEVGFPIGNYKISAFYGDINKEGFELPYYYGDSDIQVKLGETSSVTITGYLCNSMVSIKYADELTSMFNGYSASIQTEGHDRVVFAYNETRPAYLSPSMAQLYISLTNAKNETVTVNPTALDLKAKHHYIVTLGVKTDDKGTQSLDVNVTENIIPEEPITINLTDELFTAPAPTVLASAFDPEKEIEIFETITENIEAPELHVIALAGLQKANLSLTTTSGKLPVSGADNYTVDLLNASDADQANLLSMGIKCYGFFKNSAEMGVVNFGDFLSKLSEGTYKASLVITDKNGKTSIIEDETPLSLRATVKALNYEISGYIKPKFMSNEIILAVSTNCQDLKNKLEFSANNKNGGLSTVKASLTSDSDPKPTVQTNFEYTFYYKLSTDQINDNSWKVQLKYANKTPLEKDLDVDLPQFKVETDAFAKRVKIRISGVEADLVKTLVEQLKIKAGSKLVSNDYTIDRKSLADQGIIVVTGLKSDTNYSDWNLYIGNKSIRSDYSGTPISEFTTESEIDVPNGDFENIHETINLQNVNIGGEYRVAVVVGSNYQNWSNIVVNEADYWTSINDITCSQNAKNINTWFVVPSTFVEGGICTVRSVGYNHNGTTPDRSGGNGQFNTKYYCENSPTSDQLENAVGELSYNSATQDNSIFSSRPFKLKFNYSYMSYNEGGLNEENGLVEVKILDSNKKEIAHVIKNLECTSTWSFDQNNLPYLPNPSVPIEINLSEYDFGSKASSVVIIFKSKYDQGIPNIYIPTGTALSEGIGTGAYLNENNRHIATNSYHAFAMGSELKVSNVHFIYE